jgi:hypothetical protein
MSLFGFALALMRFFSWTLKPCELTKAANWSWDLNGVVARYAMIASAKLRAVVRSTPVLRGATAGARVVLTNAPGLTEFLAALLMYPPLMS